ncbi:MAG TPA: GTPase Era [Pseudogracilibacillus sp.]|nr:GTPase Era [Pseudogracilibacillus sp.]
MEKQFKSGFVTLIGRPNVGKSTLLNDIVGEKVSIVSDKIQTTRNRIHGIVTDEESQVVFVDTPGVHKPKHELGDRMVHTSLQTLRDVDIVLFLINAEEGFGRGDEFIINKMKELNIPVILVINKIDLVHPDELLPLIASYNEKMDFAETVPISALNGNNVDTLYELIKSYLPEGPQFYHEDDKTDRTLQFQMAEIIREKVLILTEEEIPHSVHVVIESVEEKNNKTHIHALIITERPSQKGILIGKGGSMLKDIGIQARKELEQLLQNKVNLQLWIKVSKDWRNRRGLLEQYGFELD